MADIESPINVEIDGRSWQVSLIQEPTVGARHEGVRPLPQPPLLMSESPGQPSRHLQEWLPDGWRTPGQLRALWDRARVSE
jgi:hypothetical protein